METIEELVSKLQELCASGSRERLIAKGLARGMIWKDGLLPEGAPMFSAELSSDLLNHGYLTLSCSIRLRMLTRQITGYSQILDDGFRTAAECIEAVVRRGARSNDRGFNIVVAAASFHIGHYGARSFSLMSTNIKNLNLVDVELLLVALMQRNLDELQFLCLSWLSKPEHTDEGIVAALENESLEFDAEDAAYTAITIVFHRAIAYFEYALRSGERQYVTASLSLLDSCIKASEQLKHVPLWWIAVLARHLIDDLWDHSLHQALPLLPSHDDNWPSLRSNFIELLCHRNIAEIDLWPSQMLAAQRVINESDSLVVALPTSSGKTRIAELCILKCLSGGRRVIYITPLRALSAQVEFTLGKTFKPLGFSVSSVYGASGIGASDIESMASAGIVVATPEKLDFAIRQDPAVINDVGLIVLDEGHMIGLSEREIRYEILVQRLLRRSDALQRRIVCLSAIFKQGDAFDAFTQWIRSDKDGNAIRSNWRPTRQRPATLEWKSSGGWLEYRVDGENVFVPKFIEQRPAKGKRRNTFPHDRNELIAAAIERFNNDNHSVLLYCPMRKSVESAAESIIKLIEQGYTKSFLANDDVTKSEISLALRIGEEWLGGDHVAMRALRLGIGVHHGQLPRPFLNEIERLLRNRVLKIAISSPTLAQGVDLSFGVLIFTSLWRNRQLLPAKEFANVIGRVGRAFVDLDGIFVLPVYESDVSTAKKRLNEFHQLVRDARGRELESGLYLLIYVSLARLNQNLGLAGSTLSEYVLNQQAAIDQIALGKDENAQQMELILAELDAGILALVEDLSCDTSVVAANLDEALKNSLWKRRLSVRPIEEQANQIAMLQGRAAHIWKRTTKNQRIGFFSASIGTDSGLQIIALANQFDALLSSATQAIKLGDTNALVRDCCKIAELLFAIHPFRPDFPKHWSVDTWKTILVAWVSGAALSQVTDSVGIAFVQDALVFKLVWGIESVRVILNSNNEIGEMRNDDDRTNVAMCMTYGVPSVSAARILERGMESRMLAVRLAKELDLRFTKRDELDAWLDAVKNIEPIIFNDSERYAWKRFVQENVGTNLPWFRNVSTCAFRFGKDLGLDIGSDVRLIPNQQGTAEVYTPDLKWVGRTDDKIRAGKSARGKIISSNELQMIDFGAMELPKWLKP